MTSKVKLVSVTSPLIEVEVKEEKLSKWQWVDKILKLFYPKKLAKRTLSPEEYVVYIARVSNPQNQSNLDTADKLLNYCIKKQHWSIFEQVDLTVEIQTSKAISAQILRHRSATFQEMCISGDTEIYFDLPIGTKPSSRRRIYKKTLSYLYNNWNKNEHLKNKIKQMFVRVLDEDTKTLTHAHIKEIFQTGTKPVFEIELHNGRKIKCTKDHKVYSDKGFVSFEEGAGLQLINKTAVISNPNFLVGCNGIPVHQSREWFIQAKQRSLENKTGLQGIADDAGVSYYTIRKWIRKHQLQFSKEEIKACTPIVWNKGKTGYKVKPRTLEQILRYRASAKKGAESPLWKGGVQRSERLKIADWCGSIRAEKLIEANYRCKVCSSNKKLELDHIKPVFSNPELAYDISNIQVLCKECHDKKHNIAGDYKFWNEDRATTKLTLNWSKIKSVRYVGEEMTYDLEIDHKSHNYVANGIIVHNSARYAKVESLEPIEFRYQDTKNRQNSFGFVGLVSPEEVIVGEDASEKDRDYLGRVQNYLQLGLALYQEGLDLGYAKECVRFVLPTTMSTRLYMKNNLRNWIHYIQVRALGEGVQKEHREIALEVQRIFKEQFPVIAKALNW